MQAHAQRDPPPDHHRGDRHEHEVDDQRYGEQGEYAGAERDERDDPDHGQHLAGDFERRDDAEAQFGGERDRERVLQDERDHREAGDDGAGEQREVVSGEHREQRRAEHADAA